MTVPADTWVELHLTILEADERAPGIPADTRQHPFVARVRGFLARPAAIGDRATVRTLIGREVEGTLTTVEPRNPADFGDASPELLDVGASVSPGAEAAR